MVTHERGTNLLQNFVDRVKNCSSKKLVGPAFVYNHNWGVDMTDKNLARGTRSFKCRCTQRPVDCQPKDGFDVILSCDNLHGKTQTKCTYSHTVGTEFSESMSNGMSVDVSVSLELEAQFWEVFRY